MKLRGKVSLLGTEAELFTLRRPCNVVICDVHSAMIIKHCFSLLTSCHFLYYERYKLPCKWTKHPDLYIWPVDENIFKPFTKSEVTLVEEIEILDVAGQLSPWRLLTSTWVNHQSLYCAWITHAGCPDICRPSGGGRARGVLGKTCSLRKAYGH